MKHAEVEVYHNQSGSPDFSRIVVSVRLVTDDTGVVVIGYPGMPNVEQSMRLGDAVLYQTTEDGMLEIRLTSIYSSSRLMFLVTQISPKFGLTAAWVEDDIDNAPFNIPELTRIQVSINDLKTKFSQSSDFVSEQLGLIDRKLDDISAASQRLGRKDWINYVVGTMTSMCISAAFSPDASKVVFRLLNDAFTWLYVNAVVWVQK